MSSTLKDANTRSRSVLCLLLAIAMASGQTWIPTQARAQGADELDRLFDDEDELNEPPGALKEPPNAPPPGSAPGGGTSTSDFGSPAGFPDGGDSADARKGGFGATAGKPSKPIKTPKTVKKGDAKKPSLADANIEDITNENYPDLIENFDYPNAEITDVIKAMSQLTGKNFIIDPSVRGKVSIVAPSQITVAEAWKAFLAALAINQFTVVPYGKFLKVKSTRNAMRDSIETYSGKYFPNSDVMITRIVHLKHISADEVNKRLRILQSNSGELTPYEPTNSLIITDFGSNVDRIMKILNELDRPGFEEQLAVIRIRFAKAKELADLINQIINKDPSRGGSGGGFGGSPGAPSFGAGVPRFRSRGQPGSGVPEELSLVAPDDRTNAIIVVGNNAGIDKIRSLVRKLDYKLDPNEAGGVFVYYVRYGEAEKLAQTLSGLAQGGGATAGAGAAAPSAFGGLRGPGGNPLTSQSIFGGDVKITADKNTNSLVITAAKTDYETVLTILAKLDIPKDQVFVEAIIMELNSQKRRGWNPNYYGLAGDPQGIGRTGFITGKLQDILNPMGDQGVVLGFGSSSTVKVTIGNSTVTVPNLLAFINLIQSSVETNILSTPRLLAQDNEEAELEVGDNVPIAQESITTMTGGTTTAPRFEKASIKLKITPFIRPDSNMVRLKIDQVVKQKAKQAIESDSTLAKAATTISERSLKTNITVHGGDTAVLGGLVRDEEDLAESKVPLLGDIPVIGWLFKSKNTSTAKINLVMFLTPKIIRTVDDNHSNLNNITNDRIEWIKKNFDGRDPYGKKVDLLPRASATQPNSKTNAPKITK